jgi:L-rhamnose mutarotase
MKSYAMALDLLDDAEVIERYKEYHRAVLPEVLDGLKSVGISKMKIFLRGTRLFMYLEAPDDFDLERDFQRYTEASPHAAEWDALMRGFQVRVPDAKPGEWWAAMEEVFDLYG